jgi:hypothetical protein
MITNEAALAAMKDACINCINRAQGYAPGESKREIINSLFPESK